MNGRDYWSTPHGQSQLSNDRANRINPGNGAHPRTAPVQRTGVTPGLPPILPLLFILAVLFAVLFTLASKG